MNVIKKFIFVLNVIVQEEIFRSLNGTMLLVYNWLKVDRPWLTHQALDILKTIELSPFLSKKLLNFEALNAEFFEIAASITKVVNGSVNSKFNIPHK
jgi:hypothetical protein